MDAPRVLLPEDIVLEIVRIVFEGYPGIHPINWVRQTATTSKIWASVSQRALFRSFTSGSTSGCGSPAARLRFRSDRPHIAAVVEDVTLYGAHIYAAELLPMLRTFTGVRVLRIYEDLFITSLHDEISPVVEAFPRLDTLVLDRYRPAQNFVAPVTATLRTLEMTAVLVSADFLRVLAAAPMGRTLLSLHVGDLHLRNLESAVAYACLFRFGNLIALRTTIMIGVELQPSQMTPALNYTHMHLVSLTLLLLETPPDTLAPLLRFLFASAVLPALRTLKIEAELGRGNSQYFQPFATHPSRAPVLADAVARALDTLRITTANVQMERDDYVDFVRLFGEATGVLELTGIAEM